MPHDRAQWEKQIKGYPIRMHKAVLKELLAGVIVEFLNGLDYPGIPHKWGQSLWIAYLPQEIILYI